jgi:putative radical SAM enzyme (TIGR03279 family)
MVTLKEVVPGSIAAELDLSAGDKLCAVNGEQVRDFLDLFLAEQQEDMLLVVEKQNGDIWELEIEKNLEDRLGIAVEHPDPKQCGNNCIFCFVHQLPKGMRRSLYIKDEDFRFSYLYGAYVTLSNIAEADIQRIIKQQLSPLYISVHATDETLRTRLLGRQSPAIMPMLKRLTEAGIELHTQIVVCPGINDGEALEQTIAALYTLSGGIRSLAVVPIGLTGHRLHLPELRTPTPVEAEEIISCVDRWQQKAQAETGSRFIFVADEFYLKAGVDFPPLENYEDLPQVENGIGQVALFRSQAVEALLEAEPMKRAVTVSTLTGESFYPELQGYLEQLTEKTANTVHLYKIENKFFSGQVTVAGLLTGQDLLNHLRGQELGEALLVPDVLLRDGEDLFLDDMTLSDLAESLGVSCVKIPSTPWGILDAMEDLSIEAV